MELAEALAEIGVDPRAATNEAWREVNRCASRHARRWRDGEGDDVVQNAMIALLRIAERGDLLDGAVSANAFVRTLVKFERTNLWKKWRKRVDFVETFDDVTVEAAELSEVEINEARTRLDRFFAIIEDDVERFEATNKAQRAVRPGDRAKRAAMRRERMRAALLRALEYSFDEIRAALGIDHSLQNLANRIVLGRKLLVAMLDRRDFPDIDPAAIEVMRALLAGPGRGHGRVGGMKKPRSQAYRDAQAERIREVWRKRKGAIAEAA